MLTPAQKANNKARVQILRDIAFWYRFDEYFERDWQRKEIRERLEDADVSLRLAGECAMCSFHELAKDEAKWTRERGKEFMQVQRMRIEVCNRAGSAYSSYSHSPNFASGMADLVDENEIQAQMARQLLERAEKSAIFDTRRLGSNWNCLYLVLLKYYISHKTGSNETEIMRAIAHLVGAAHYALQRRPPENLRVLLQKAIGHFEQNSNNATLIDLVKKAVLNPQQLQQMFPPIRISAQ